MKKKAFLFPGQGSQYPGMGKDFYDAFPIAKETFQEADDILGMHLSKILFEGPLDELTRTHHSQPGIFVHSVAILRTLAQQIPDLKPSVCSGLSLGEYTALYASGRLPFGATLRLIRERALGMTEACEKTKGSMAAILGVSGEEIEEAIAPFKGQVWIANYNAPGQIVLSGTKEGILLACVKLKEKGRVLPLQVHGAFHSGLMQSAQDRLAPFVMNSALEHTEIGFVMNVPGDFASEEGEIRKNLILQVTHSVRWEQGIRAMMSRGTTSFLEIGCGKTLAGLNKKMGASTLSVDKVADLDKIGSYATA